MRINLNKKLMPTLYDININSKAKIHSLSVNHESSFRLSEMGLIPGSIVRVIKKNPFGGPIQLKLNDYYLAIRKEDAKMIFISQ